MDLPRIFISHNKADKETARFIGGELLRLGANVWFDEWEIQAGDSIIDKVENGLVSCDIFLILMSPNSMKSVWVREELKSALMRRLSEGNIKVVPILLRDCDVAPLLLDTRYIDFRASFEEGFEELTRIVIGRSSKPLLTDSQVNAILGFRKDLQLRQQVLEVLRFIKSEMPEALDILFNCGDLSMTMESGTFHENLAKFTLLFESGLFESANYKLKEGDNSKIMIALSVKALEVFRAFCFETNIFPRSIQQRH